MALAGMPIGRPIGRPSDRDPEAWFHLAVQMDQNQAADDAFHSQVLSTAFTAAPPCEPSTLLMGTDARYDTRQMDVDELLKVLESKPVRGGHPTDEEFHMPRRVAHAKPAPVRITPPLPDDNQFSALGFPEPGAALDLEDMPLEIQP